MNFHIGQQHPGNAYLNAHNSTNQAANHAHANQNCAALSYQHPCNPTGPTNGRPYCQAQHPLYNPQAQQPRPPHSQFGGMRPPGNQMAFINQYRAQHQSNPQQYHPQQYHPQQYHPQHPPHHWPPQARPDSHQSPVSASHANHHSSAAGHRPQAAPVHANHYDGAGPVNEHPAAEQQHGKGKSRIGSVLNQTMRALGNAGMALLMFATI
jgi:hypothetical protein